MSAEALSLIDRAMFCLEMASRQPTPNATVGAQVRAGILEGVVVRFYCPADKRLPNRVRIRTSTGREVWVSESAVRVVETPEQTTARIQDSAASMLKMWDDVIPGDGRTYGEHFLSLSSAGQLGEKP